MCVCVRVWCSALNGSSADVSWCSAAAAAAGVLPARRTSTDGRAGDELVVHDSGDETPTTSVSDTDWTGSTLTSELNATVIACQDDVETASDAATAAVAVPGLDVVTDPHVKDTMESDDSDVDLETRPKELEDDEKKEAEEEEERQVRASPNGRFLKFDKNIGQGAFKTVFKGLDTETGVLVAWCELQVSHLLSLIARGLSITDRTLMKPIFTARCYANVVYAVVLCLSVRHKPVLY